MNKISFILERDLWYTPGRELGVLLWWIASRSCAAAELARYYECLPGSEQPAMVVVHVLTGIMLNVTKSS